MSTGAREPTPQRGLSPGWLTTLRWYLALVAGASLLWESAHLPLYTIWREGDPYAMAFAVAHCTGGDLLIALAALALALLAAGHPRWPAVGFAPVAALAVTFGVAYTAFSEWLNVEVRQSWAYSDLMPVVPGTGTGLSPLAQWVVIPATALLLARRMAVRPPERPGDSHDGPARGVVAAAGNARARGRRRPGTNSKQR